MWGPRKQGHENEIGELSSSRDKRQFLFLAVLGTRRMDGRRLKVVRPILR